MAVTIRARSRSRLWSCRVAVMALLVVVFGGSVVLAATEMTGPLARLDGAADRGAAVVIGGSTPETVVLIGDSVLASLEYGDAASRLADNQWQIDAAVCRRLVAESCSAPSQPVAPSTLVEALAALGRSGAIDDASLLVVGVGYNDSVARFRGDVTRVLEAAAAAGFGRVAWLTYHAGPEHAGRNAVLVEMAAGNTDFELLDFDRFIDTQPGAVAGDGVHLTAAGAKATADWLIEQTRLD